MQNTNLNMGIINDFLKTYQDVFTQKIVCPEQASPSEISEHLKKIESILKKDLLDMSNGKSVHCVSTSNDRLTALNDSHSLTIIIPEKLLGHAKSAQELSQTSRFMYPLLDFLPNSEKEVHEVLRQLKTQFPERLALLRHFAHNQITHGEVSNQELAVSIYRQLYLNPSASFIKNIFFVAALVGSVASQTIIGATAHQLLYYGYDPTSTHNSPGLISWNTRDALVNFGYIFSTAVGIMCGVAVQEYVIKQDTVRKTDKIKEMPGGDVHLERIRKKEFIESFFSELPPVPIHHLYQV